MRLRHSPLRLSLLFLMLFALAVSLGAVSAQGGKLTVHFLDVGQADSILIQAPGGQAILIDGGNNADGPSVVNYLKQQGITRLNAVIATHPHEDHIGGLDTVLNTFPVETVYLPNVTHTSRTFEDFVTAARKAGKRIQVKPGVKLNIPGITAVFLAPHRSYYEDLNDYSAVLKLTYGKVSFLFAGDAEATSESEMVNSGSDLSSTILKVGHHGSDSSTTAAFLRAVSPKYAVISVGEGNPYGHPSESTLERLRNAGVTVYRTDQNGNIVATSDGSTVKFTTSRAGSSKGAAPIPSESNSDVIVYITKTGSKYHRAGCRYLARSCIPIPLSEAKKLGYMPCSVCRPPI